MYYLGDTPTRAYPDDAGFDLTVVGDQAVEPRSFANLLLATQIASFEGHWTLLIGRSSTFKNRGLLMNPGIIDPGYTGPLYAVVYNLTTRTVHISHGERICQAIPMVNVAAGIDPAGVTALPERPRGHNGFGSSGR